jgi:hypothetical protein
MWPIYLGINDIGSCMSYVFLCLAQSDVFRSGESEKLATRYRKFNLQGLLDASVKTVGIDGISCMLFSLSILQC